MVAFLIYDCIVPIIGLERSYELLDKVVQNLYSRRHSPVPGAMVKAQLMIEAQLEGLVFNERQLGFDSFLSYIKTASRISIQIRPGSDMLLVPSTVTDTLSAYAVPLPIIRRDFWRAFIAFPVENSLRIYDPDEDKIFYDIVPTNRKGIAIDPVTRAEHIGWRKTFAKDQPEPTSQELLTLLNNDGPSIFTEFARRLRENPAIMHAWNLYLQKKITDRVIEWGNANGITEERWSGGLSKFNLNRTLDRNSFTMQNLGQRAELYNFLDNLPIDDLLQLRVPLDWVLKVMRNNQ
jgi:hypothetical protein